jgi:hypothetical protein
LKPKETEITCDLSAIPPKKLDGIVPSKKFDSRFKLLRSGKTSNAGSGPTILPEL